MTRKKFCLSLHCNETNSYIFVNGTEIHKFKGKNCEINAISLSLVNIPKTIYEDNMKKS